ncbi:MerR family transcriptional regulator [Spirillospora sp. NPDC029432]|uniref:MerR family transcriptional regulator n=1 Tax=Spirillospora sp. NPDC029432 TaxID=3154599 RepID=UPI003452EB36
MPPRGCPPNQAEAERLVRLLHKARDLIGGHATVGERTVVHTVGGQVWHGAPTAVAACRSTLDPLRLRVSTAPVSCRRCSARARHAADSLAPTQLALFDGGGEVGATRIGTLSGGTPNRHGSLTPLTVRLLLKPRAPCPGRPRRAGETGLTFESTARSRVGAVSTMRISQLAEHTGVSASTLRYYDHAGLLPADRAPAGYRRYGPAAIERLEFIAAAKHLGLSLEEIAGLLVVRDTGSCAQVRARLRPQLTAQIDQAEHRITQLRAFTATLRAAVHRLDALPDRPASCDPACHFLDPALRTGTPRPSHTGRLAPAPAG